MSWNTFLGGLGFDTGSDISVDEIGNIYIVGTSTGYYLDSSGTSTDPTWGSPNRAFGGGDSDVFVAKLNSSGVLVWNTFLGGTGSDSSTGGIVTDGSGNIYITGISSTSWGNPIQAHSNSGSNGFLAKLTSSGVLTWHTFLGNSGLAGIDLDSNGNIYLTGSSTDNLSIPNSPLNPHSGNLDAFIIKMTSSGSSIWYTFLGGSAQDTPSEIVVSKDDNVYIVGTSYATWGTPVRPYLSSFWNSFAAKLDSSGALTWNTFLGAGRDQGYGIAIDESENVYVTGVSASTWGNPVRAFEHPFPFPTNGFAAKLNSSGALSWNTFLGNGNDDSNGVDLDANGFVYVTGTSCESWGIPFQAISACPDSYVAKLDGAGNLLTNGFFGGSSDDYGSTVYAYEDGDVYMLGGSEAGWGDPVRSFSKDSYDSTNDADVFIVRLAIPSPPPIYVTNANDNGTGSLRQAIADATNGDTVAFAPSLAGQTIRLTSELVVDKSIKIDGSNLTPNVRISGDTDNDGDGDTLLMSIDASATIVVKNLFFEFGNYSMYESAGGINNYGNLTIRDSNFENNHGSLGGAIFNNAGATAIIENSFFAHNIADTANGGEGGGGGIGNLGNLTISNSQFSENSSLRGGGAIVNALNGTITITNSTFTLNSAKAEGGGAIYNIDNAIIISGSIFDSNTSTSDGGAIYNAVDGTTTLSSVTFIENSTPKNGGAIFSFAGSINISNSIFSSNSAGLDGGGGIFNNTDSTAIITNTVFNQNSAQGSFGAGGAIANIGNLTVNNSEFTQNKAIDGGGAIINSIGGVAFITNSTIFKNTSTDGGGGIATAHAYTATTLTNVTLSNNSGGGLYIFDGNIHLINSIFANSSGQPDCYKSGGSVDTNLNTLIENNATGINSCGTPLLTSDPKLGPLANNGGATKTMALLPGSPAIDAGNDATCAAAPVNNTSQNGVTRPQGSRCDIGAYEFKSKPDLIITNVTINPVTPGVNQTFEINITVKNQGDETGSNIVYRDVYIDRDPSTLINPATGCPPPGDFFRADYFTSLPAGWEDTKTITITGGLPTGQYQLWFYVDSRCLIDEGSGSNSAP